MSVSDEPKKAKFIYTELIITRRREIILRRDVVKNSSEKLFVSSPQGH